MIRPRAVAPTGLPWTVALVVLLGLATWGEGGAAAGTLLAVHALVGLLLFATLLRSPGGFAVALAPRVGFAAFACVAMVGALFAPYGYAAWLFVLELAVFLAVCLVAGRCGPDLPTRLATPMLAVASVQGGFAVWQRLSENAVRPAATFANPNHLGGWLVATLLLAWGVGFGAMDRRAISVRAALSLPALAGLTLTGSRGAILGLGAGGLALAVAAWPRIPVRRRRIAAGLALGLFLLGSGVVLARRLGEPDPFRYQRLRIWRASLQALVDSPWLGTGPRQFAFAAANLKFPDGEGPLRYDRKFSTPHSDLLRVPCELGWPGLLALLFAAGAAAHVVRVRARGVLDPAASGALAACVALAAQAGVDDLSQRPAIYLLAAALLGSLLATRTPGEARPGVAAKSVIGLLLVIVYAVGDVAPYRAWRAVSDLPRGALDEKGRSSLERALRWNPIHPDYWMREAEDLVADGSRLDRVAYARARNAAERAIRLNPADPRARRVLARVEARACRSLFRDTATRERAAQQFRAAERLGRFDPFVALELAGFLIDTGAPDQARRPAERALALEPESVVPRLMLADVLISSGSAAGAAHARRLLQEARERAERWESRTHRDIYSHELLRLDEGRMSQLESRLAGSGS